MSGKKSLRQEMLNRRAQFTPTFVKNKSALVNQRLVQLESLQSAQNVLLYMSIRNEIDLKEAIQALWEQGNVKVILPRTDKKQKKLYCYHVKHLDDLEVGAFGISEPNPLRCEEIPPTALDVLFLPGVAFDQSGYRLGYGGGYYDRFLHPSLKAIRIGIAYDEQMVDTVYPEKHDQQVDIIITPTKTIRNPSNNSCTME
ncbi:5-formyltetrahydrofolate cyclo-ligase [Hazenella sp. IB182353]|uniref:5-formyltetrahydrofolate cyclo-ligase n=1 Tax=Polycladospora coralii TaxID=2771432 RepID=UPI0017475391|nr:5-formyltetrahydrofolate cyclo-ligase [Polycladospora coralii]MBS7531525.1 5-formyltetrahydrofolate cyclo-ligase [Polycladospora coralii]